MKFGRLQNGLLRAQPETAPSNFISNPTPLKDTTGWSLYSDAAGTAPTDGTGGSVNTGTEINFTRTTSSPLSETASFLFSKIATSSMQGKGVSYDFTINRADQAKVCRIDFDYEVASGTYADGDLTVWLYDVTNAQLIQPSASSILNAIGPQKKQPLSFQTNSNSTSYRLIIHVASTSTSAYTVKFDNVSVTRESISQGTVVTDWVSYTPTTAGLGAVSSIVFSWRCVGDSVEILGRLNTGTPTATFATISLPSGLIADTAKISSSGQIVGSVIVNTSITSVGWYLIGTGSSSNLNIGIRATTTTSGFAYANGNAISNSSGDTISFIATVPILGWSSSQQLSSDADTREVSAKYSLTSNETTAANADHIMTNFTTRVYDSHGMVSGSRLTAPVPGKYKITLKALTTSVSWAATDVLVAWLGKNGATQTEMIHWERLGVAFTDRYLFKGNAEVELKAGETIDFNIRNNTGGGTVPVIDSVSGLSTIEIEKLSGPAQIAASEQILVKAQNGAGTSFTGGAGYTDIPFATEVYDSHGSFATPLFTAPAPGYYEMTVNLYFGAVNLSTSQAIDLQFVNNGTAETKQIVYGTGVSRQFSLTATDTYYLLAGQTLKARAAGDVTASLVATAARNYVTIKRLGGIG